MSLKDVMDPIEYYEYISSRVERGLSVDETPIEKVPSRKPIKTDYKKVLDPIQYYEYMSEMERR